MKLDGTSLERVNFATFLWYDNSTIERHWSFTTGHRYLDNGRPTSAKIVSRSWMEHFILYISLIDQSVLLHTRSDSISYL